MSRATRFWLCGLVVMTVHVGAAMRYYWPTSVAQLARGLSRHTHVEVKGTVIRSRLETDGDRHIWLRDFIANDSVLGECVPKLACPAVRDGTVVILRGISRRDPEHGWYEVHPVEEIVP